VRCTETLRPLAQLTGEKVRVVTSLHLHNKSSRTGSADSGPDIDSLIREAIASGEPTVVCAHRVNLPDLRAAALAVLTGHVAAGEAKGSSADDELDEPFELPKEWDDVLNTSGFWVLNVARLPPPPEPEMAEREMADLVAAREAEGETMRQAAKRAGPPAAEPPARPLWRRLLRLPARDDARDAIRAGQPAGPAELAEMAGLPVPGDEALVPALLGAPVPDAPEPIEAPEVAAASEPADARPPVGVLVSADHYDLAELS
jgi:hypothetical protein